MPFVYSRVLTLEGVPKVGTKQCVALLQQFTPEVGRTSLWKEGDVVLGNTSMVPGTAIATFVNGRYPSERHVNHAAYFLRQAVNGFYVMDQWSNDAEKQAVSSRLIRIKGKQKNSGGRWPQGGNNAYAYAIIER